MAKQSGKISLFLSTLALFILILGATCLSFFFAQHAQAAIDDTGIDTDETISTNPKSREVTVTATVPDNTPPTAPILIHPANGELLSSGYITFIWEPSTDDSGISHYYFYLDGNTPFGSLPTTNQETAEYNYFITDNGTRYNLTFKQAIPDGLHTWKVRAFDNTGQNTDSATWSFTIDSAPPSLVVNQIGEKTVAIWAQDSSTVPTSPITIFSNPPILAGITEAGATVTISVSIPGQPVVQMTTTANSTGGFSFTLPLLPINVTITVQVVAVDAIGNRSVIDGIPIMVIRRVIPLPSPLPPFPIIPPEEIREVIKEIIKEKVQPFVPEPIVDIVDTVSPFSNSLIGLLIPLLRLIAVLWLTGAALWNISLRILMRALHRIGLLPNWFLPPVPVETKGIVFDSATQKRIPYALVNILRIFESSQAIVEQDITDEYGEYNTIRVSAQNAYTLLPQRQRYIFSAADAARLFSDHAEVYIGQRISTELCDALRGKENAEKGLECGDGKLLIHFAVPMERPEEEGRLERTAVTVAKLPNSGLTLATLVMAVIAFFSPAPWNIAVFITYAVALTRRGFRNTEK